MADLFVLSSLSGLVITMTQQRSVTRRWTGTASDSLRSHTLASAWRRAKYRAQGNRVLSLAHHLMSRTVLELDAIACELRWKIQSASEPEKFAIHSFACTAAMVKQVYGYTPYLVQIMGALSMLNGEIAEMQTGEGKTLTALFPTVLQGMTGRGCHVITSNDYLAARDAEFARPLLMRMGLSVAALTNSVQRPDRAQAYACDVTYGTEKEFGFDFLKDQLVRSTHSSSGRVGHPIAGTGPLWGIVQRPRNFALIDEADSLLIDQARTPLIIALPQPFDDEEVALFKWCHQIAHQLRPVKHYEFEIRRRVARLTEQGCRQIAFSQRPEILKHFPFDHLFLQVERALTAKDGFECDREFLIADGKVEIIDEGTGRVLPGRKWQDGLQQAIELEAGVELSETTGTAARMTLQSYLSGYPHVCGMTGTTNGVRSELLREYGTPVTAIPTNRRNLRRKYPARVFANQQAKMDAIAEEVRDCVLQGRSVLIGTASVAASEHCAETLRRLGIIEVSVLHAKHHELEAGIVASAGQPGRVTVATNMAGRGTDIKVADSVRLAGGLHVICTEMNRSPRIDRQLIGRTARQGDPGSYRIYVSLDDSLLESLGTERWVALKKRSARLAPGIELPRSWLCYFLKAQRRLEQVDRRARRQLISEEKARVRKLSSLGLEPSVDMLEERAVS